MCGRASLIVSAISQGAFVTAPHWQGHSRICKGRAWHVQPSRCRPWPASLTEGGGTIPITQSQVPAAKRVPDLSPEASRSGEAADVCHWQPPQSRSVQGWTSGGTLPHGGALPHRPLTSSPVDAAGGRAERRAGNDQDGEAAPGAPASRGPGGAEQWVLVSKRWAKVAHCRLSAGL